MVIGSGNCTNFVSEDIINKLKLKMELLPNPYNKRCSVTFTTGGLIDMV